jgi:uncharacterized protein
LLARLRRNLVVPDPVLAEVDYMLRTHVSRSAARAFLAAVAAGEHDVGYMTPGLLRRATQIDADYADLNLGFVDASVMAYAERHKLPVLTFDFADFRATATAERPWKLVVDERQYAEAVGRSS